MAFMDEQFIVNGTDSLIKQKNIQKECERKKIVQECKYIVTYRVNKY